MNVPFELREYGERAILVQLEDNAQVHQLAAAIAAHREDLQEIVPGHRTLLLSWPGTRPERRHLEQEIARLIAIEAPSSPGRSVTVPVIYDGADLEEIGQRSGLDREGVIHAHSESDYRVAFIGFMPGFAYLVGGDPRLKVPRRRIPRTRVPGGSVALAGPYSAIYPTSAPGGWSLLGHTSLEVFDLQRDDPTLLRPGDRVRFEPGVNRD